MLTILVVLGASYLLGSTPTAYLAARYLRGFDIRQRGSGQVGGTNIWHSVSRKVGIAVSIVDIAKGMLAVTAARLLGFELGAQVLSGVAVVCGHNWSVFLGFSGGRGIAPLGGVILLMAPKETVVFAVFALLGVAFKAAPVGVILGVAGLPVAAWLLHEPPELITGLFALFLIVLLKRVMSKRRLPDDKWKKVIFYRIVFDRDIRSREAWVRQEHRPPQAALQECVKPGNGPESSAP